MQAFSSVFRLIGLTMLGIGGWLANQSRELLEAGEKVPAAIEDDDETGNYTGSGTTGPFVGDDRNQNSGPFL